MIEFVLWYLGVGVAVWLLLCFIDDTDVLSLRNLGDFIVTLVCWPLPLMALVLIAIAILIALYRYRESRRNG